MEPFPLSSWPLFIPMFPYKTSMCLKRSHMSNWIHLGYQQLRTTSSTKKGYFRNFVSELELITYEQIRPFVWSSEQNMFLSMSFKHRIFIDGADCMPLKGMFGRVILTLKTMTQPVQSSSYAGSFKQPSGQSPGSDNPLRTHRLFVSVQIKLTLMRFSEEAIILSQNSHTAWKDLEQGGFSVGGGA